MKNTKRRLMSLLLALALICSMAPAAMAYGRISLTVGESTSLRADEFEAAIEKNPALVYFYGYIEWGSTNPTVVSVSGGGLSADITARRAGSATITASLSAQGIGSFYQAWSVTVTGDGTIGGTIGGSGTSTNYLTSLSRGSMSLAVGGRGELTVSPYTSNSNHVQISSVTWSSSNNRIATVSDYGVFGTSASVYGVSAGEAVIYAEVAGSYYSGNRWFDFSNVLGCTVTVGSGVGSGTGTGTDSGYFYISPNTLQLNASGDYALLSTAPYAAGTALNLNGLTWYSDNPSVVSVDYYNDNISDNSTVGSSIYVYGVSAGAATITAYYNGSIYATCYVTVGGGATGGDIIHTLTKGESMALDAESFQKFWAEAVNGYGALEYVRFGNISGTVGNLTYNRYLYGYNTSQTTSVVGSTLFYVNPAYNQYGIDNVTFTPNTTGTRYITGTLTVPFTAYGTDNNYSSTTVSRSGIMYIVVTDGDVEDISYSFSDAGVALDGSDFQSVYRQEVSNATANSNVYIQFLDVPAFGSLYYNYNSLTTGTRLTRSNIGSLRFSSQTNASYSIDAMTYVPGNSNSSDTVRYAAYSSAAGGAILYVGEVTFSRGVVASIKYFGAPNQAISFDGDDFYAINALRYSDYISFGTPTSGTLYKDHGTSSASRVATNDLFTVSGATTFRVRNIDDVTFVPSTNFTGVVEIPFSTYNLLNKATSGTVKIFVAKKFSDVSTDHWAYDFITQLTAEGIVDGMTPTTFAPNQNLKYGEALKLIMEAAGYPELVKTGTHWASGYLTRAYRDGLVSSTNIDLNTAIDRNTIASITAKALGLSAVTNTSASPFADSRDGYVLALYNAGIIDGTLANGNRYYNGDNAITRAEISKIICLVADYAA